MAAQAVVVPVPDAWTSEFENALMDSDLRKKLKAVTFFKVPAQLMAGFPDDFQPKVLRLGLHNLEPDLTSPAQMLKIALAREFMECAIAPGRKPVTVEHWRELAAKVVDSPEKWRLEYGVDACDALVTNLLFVDVVFVAIFLQASRGVYESNGIKQLVWSRSFKRDMLQMESDLFLLENQIPISLLKAAVAELSPAKGVESGLDAILKQAVMLAYPFVRTDLEAHLEEFYSGPASKGQALENCQHILDCVYHVVGNVSIAPPVRPATAPPATAAVLVSLKDVYSDPITSRTQIDSQDRSPSATALRNLGVKFSGTDIAGEALTVRRVRMERSGALWSTTVLRLPQVAMYDGTAALLRNLATYEQLAHPAEVQIRGYLTLMSALTGTVEDAQLLGKSGVIKNHLGSHEQVAEAWIRMCEGVGSPEVEAQWKQVRDDMSSYCNSKVNKWRADVRTAICSKPTIFFSFLIATLLVLFTILQTYISILDSQNFRQQVDLGQTSQSQGGG